MPRRLLVIIAGLAVFAPAVGAEAQTIAQTPGKPLARDQFVAEMDAEFRKTDADKNGQLTSSEIEEYQKLQAAAQAEARNRALFAQLDTDKNGRLSKTEFAKMVYPVPAANAQPMLSRMDGNRDNQVSLVEHRTATQANFDRLDTDKDGNVTAAEMQAGGVKPR